MKRNKKRIIAAVAVIGALAAGGAAYTANVDGTPTTAAIGFAQTSITGATADGVSYNLSADGQYIQQANIYFSPTNAAAISGETIDAGFGDEPSTTSYTNNVTLITCSAPATDGLSTGTYANDDVSVCDFTDSGANDGVPVNDDNGGAQYFDVSVTNSSGNGASSYNAAP
ncbi:MAG TPA: hypothetical protein VMF57_21320 [Solirubrobacteraceae bacterium]|nr:hypothetical protein [Solirubrobacteraceae bacterium]